MVTPDTLAKMSWEAVQAVWIVLRLLIVWQWSVLNNENADSKPFSFFSVANSLDDQSEVVGWGRAQGHQLHPALCTVPRKHPVFH